MPSPAAAGSGTPRGGLTYLDTKYVAATAIGLFAKDILIESGELKQSE